VFLLSFKKALVCPHVQIVDNSFAGVSRIPVQLQVQANRLDTVWVHPGTVPKTGGWGNVSGAWHFPPSFLALLPIFPKGAENVGRAGSLLVQVLPHHTTLLCCGRRQYIGKPWHECSAQVICYCLPAQIQEMGRRRFKGGFTFSKGLRLD